MWSAPRPLLCNGAVNTPKQYGTIKDWFSVGSVQSEYKEAFGSIEQYRTVLGSVELSFEMPVCQDMSMELN
jgi:hypothetical protein